MKKHPFSLVEIAIALPLLALLFSSLLFHFSSTLRLKKDLKVMQKEVLDDHYFRFRLQKILYQDAKNFTFNQGVLHFDYQNRASINPKACGKVSATLQALDNQLVLKVYHRTKNGGEELIREEKFFNHVDQLQWKYIYEEKQNTILSQDNHSTCPFAIHDYAELQASKDKKLAALEISIIKNNKLLDKHDTYFFNLQPILSAS